MPRRARKPADLSAAEFRRQLKLHGFLKLSLEGTYCDIRARGCPRIEPVMRDKRIDRSATLTALFAGRAARQTAAEAEAAARARCEQVAAAIAPKVAPVCRASLTDPAAAIAQLADDFVVQSTRGDGVLRGDLILMGWQPAQLDAHAPAALLLAYRKQEGVAA